LDVAIEVVPFEVPAMSGKFFLVLFQPAIAPEAAVEKKLRGTKPRARPPVERAELMELQEELASTRESLQAIIEEHEAGNEELRSAMKRSCPATRSCRAPTRSWRRQRRVAVH